MAKRRRSARIALQDDNLISLEEAGNRLLKLYKRQSQNKKLKVVLETSAKWHNKGKIQNALAAELAAAHECQDAVF